MLATPGSQHAKYLPIIQKTISKANPRKIWDDFKKCTEGVRLPKFEDVPLVRKKSTTDGSFGMRPLNEADSELYMLLRTTNGFANGFGLAETLIGKILNESTPTFEIELMNVGEVFSVFEPVMPPERLSLWKSITSRLERVLFGRGCRRYDVMTPFEHALIDDAGSGYALLASDGRVDFSRQHTPLSLITRKMGLQESAVNRELKVLGSANSRFYGLHGRDKKMVGVSLSPLNMETGQTLLMPEAINIADLGDALKKHPLIIAFGVCKLPGAKLDVAAVEERVMSVFKH